jgi:branched-chain amino acid transport system ATP-binding protein
MVDAKLPHNPAELVVNDLVASYGNQTVLHGVTITVPAGSCVSVLGSNGAGKTTLMNAIAGVHRRWRGRIEMDGRDLGDLHSFEIARSGVCYVPEGRGVFPDLTVSENLGISIGRDKDTRERLFTYFPVLARFSRRQAGTLSGGEQGMLAIAPALMGSYRLLLVDELSLGLAPLVVEMLFSLLDEIKARGVSILIVEQFADRALAISERAYVLRKGSVVFDGAAAALRGKEDLLHRLYLGSETEEERV